MNVSWLILDAMGVVYRVGDDVGELLIPFIRERNPEASASQIDDAYFRASLGQFGPNEFWQEVGLASEYPRVEKEYLDSQIELNDQFESAIVELKHRFQLAMLSNDIDQWSKFLRDK